MLNKVAAASGHQVMASRIAIAKEKAYKKNLLKKASTRQNYQNYHKMQSYFSRSRDSEIPNANNNYLEYISDVNHYISLQYSPNDPFINSLPTLIPNDEKMVIPCHECLIGDEVLNSLSCSCISNDGRYFAVWDEKKVAVLNIEDKSWFYKVDVEFETLNKPNQVFFLSNCKTIAIVEGQRVAFHGLKEKEIIKTFSLPKDEEGNPQDNFEPLTFKYFHSVNGQVPHIGEHLDRHPLFLELCDEYFLYFLKLRPDVCDGITATEVSISRYELPIKIKEFRGCEFYIPLGTKRYLTIRYDSQATQPTTIFTFWKVDVEYAYDDNHSQYKVRPNGGVELVKLAEYVEINMRVVVVDKQPYILGKEKIWIYDSISHSHKFLKWHCTDLGCKLSIDNIMKNASEHEPTHIHTASNNKYSFIKHGDAYLTLFSLSDEGYIKLSSYRLNEEVTFHIPYSLEFFVIRGRTSLTIYPLDLPPGHRAELLSLPANKCFPVTSSVLMLENEILVSVDINSKVIYYKANKYSPMTYISLLNIASNLGYFELSTLREMVAIEGTAQVLFFFANRDTYVGVYYDCFFMVVDFAHEHLKPVRGESLKKHDLKQIDTYTLGFDGKSFTLSHQKGLTLFFTDVNREPIHFECDGGRALLLPGVAGKDYLMNWNSKDNCTEPSCCFKYFDIENPTAAPGEECPLNMFVDYKKYTMSANKTTLILYGKEGFCTFDVNTKKYNLCAPENTFSLGDHSLQLSPNGKLLAIHSAFDHTAYIYCVDTLRRQSLGPCTTSNKYMVFTFVESLNQLIMYDEQPSKVKVFYKKEVEEAEFPTFVMVGEHALRKDLNLISITASNKSLFLLGMYLTTPQLITKLRLPLNNVNHLNLTLIRRQIALYHSTDSPEKKNKSLKRIMLLIKLNPIHAHYLHPIFAIILYFLNHPDGLVSYSQIAQNMDVLFFRHNLLDMFFTVNAKESMKNVLKLMKEFNDEQQRYPEIDAEGMVLLITTLRRKLLTDQLREEMLCLLMFAPYHEPFTGELQDDSLAMTSYDPPVEAVGETEQITLKSDRIKTSLSKIMKTEAHNLNDYQVFESLFPLDVGTGSSFSRSLFSLLKYVSDERLKTDFKPLIYFKWSRILKYALIYTFLHWVMNIMLYIFLGYDTESIGLGVAIIVINCFFLLFELKCFATSPISYIKDWWNYIDIGVQIFSIFTCANVWGTKTRHLTVRQNYIRLFCVLAMSFRSITWFRVFRSTRYLITMILIVFVDVTPYLIMLIPACFITAFAWRMIPTLGPDYVGSEISFFESIMVPIDMLYGNGPSNEAGETAVRFWVILLGNGILALVFLNYLIALIGATFERISSDKELYDVVELLYIIRDFDSFFSGINEWVRKVFKRFTVRSKHYLSVTPTNTKQNEIMELKRHFDAQLDKQNREMLKCMTDTREAIYQHSVSTREEVKREGLHISGLVSNIESLVKASDEKWRKMDNRIDVLEDLLVKLLEKNGLKEPGSPLSPVKRNNLVKVETSEGL